MIEFEQENIFLLKYFNLRVNEFIKKKKKIESKWRIL